MLPPFQKSGTALMFSEFLLLLTFQMSPTFDLYIYIFDLSLQLYSTCLVGFKKLTEVIYLVKYLFALVRIGNIGTVFKLFHEMDSRGISALACHKRLMLRKIEAATAE